MNDTSGNRGSGSPDPKNPLQKTPNGTVRKKNKKKCVYYDGYWIRRYEVPTDEVAARRELIDQLTKRVFHHTEAGINTPGYNLKEAREKYEVEPDPEKKRVNAAMLAGALLNRGSDIFSMIFELNRRGIEIREDNELMLECESCFLEAFDLGKQVKHYSGEEGLDELWGEPLKIFSMPVSEFYESRYIKIAQTMSAIDSIADRLLSTLSAGSMFSNIMELIQQYSSAAKLESETIKSDPAIFSVWPEFVVSGDKLEKSLPNLEDSQGVDETTLSECLQLVVEGKKLIEWIAFARVPMPKTTEKFFRRCESCRKILHLKGKGNTIPILHE